MSQPVKVVKRRRRIVIPTDQLTPPLPTVSVDNDGVRAPDPIVYDRLVGSGPIMWSQPQQEVDLVKAIEKSRREAEEQEMRAAMELIAQMEANEARERAEREKKEAIEREKETRMRICDEFMKKIYRLKCLGDAKAEAVYRSLEPTVNEYRLWGTTTQFTDEQKQAIKEAMKTMRFTEEERQTLLDIVFLQGRR